MLSQINFVYTAEHTKFRDTKVMIGGCIFTDNKLRTVTIGVAREFDFVTFEWSNLTENGLIGSDCSVLFIHGMYKFILRGVNIKNNNCTGVKLSNSTMRIERNTHLVRNSGQQGGALSLLQHSNLISPDLPN